MITKELLEGNKSVEPLPNRGNSLGRTIWLSVSALLSVPLSPAYRNTVIPISGKEGKKLAMSYLSSFILSEQTVYLLI
jgi:hypothetical protein